MFDVGRLKATARLWWRMMRMQRVTREGWFYVGFTLVVGAAAINTGNNLLYLILGLQLSLILLSALLSESVLRGIEIRRELPSHGVAGRPFWVGVRLLNHKRRFASYSLVVQELEGPVAGVRTFASRIPARGELRLAYEAELPRRGVFPFGGVRLTTRFPFGLFEKSREFAFPEELSVHPQGHRIPMQRLHPLVGAGERPEPKAGSGHEFHALREYRSGDDPRQVHWRSSARVGRLVSIEREAERRRRITLLVDGRGLKQPRDLDAGADAAVALARRYLAEGCEVGLSWSGGTLQPGAGPGQLGRVGEAAARLAPSPVGAPGPKVHRGAHPVVVPLAARHIEGGEATARAVKEGQATPVKGRLTLHGAQRASLLAAVAAAFASLAISGELPLWARMGFGASAILGLMIREGSAQKLRNASNLLALGALIVLAAQVLMGSADVIVAAPTFAVALAASRLLGRRGPVDDALLLLAALLMIAGGAALTGDLAYGVAFVFFAVAATVALCLSHLRRESEEIEGVEASRKKGTVSGALVGALALLSLTVLVGSALVFIAFPRVSSGMMRRGPDQRVGGIPERIELGGVGVLKDDPTPVMRVRFPNGEPVGELYWRTGAFATWDGKGWSRPLVEKKALSSTGGAYHLAPPNRGAIVADVEVLSHEPGLPVPGAPLEVKFPSRQGQMPPLLLEGADGGLEVRGHTGELRYRVTAAPRPNPSVEAFERFRDEGLPPEEWLSVPEALDPRIRALASSLSRGERLESVEAVLAHLEQGYRYTRELPGEKADPLAHFLFERREGHCEYFATAFTILLRLNGIPSRVVAGYYGATHVEAGGYWVVRQGDAHAWTEAYFPEIGWVRFDATPAAVRPGEAHGSWAELVQWMDVMRVRWNEWVLDFDGRNQLRIASAFAEAFSRQAGAGRNLAPWARGGVAALCLIGAGWLALRLRRKLEEERGPPLPPGQRRAVALFRTVKKVLRKRGVKLPVSATATAWGQAAAVAAPEKAAAVQEAIAAYEGARFGNRGLDREEIRRLKRELRRRVG